MAVKDHFIPELHALRGFAIFNIVAAHAWSFLIFWSGELNTPSLKLLFFSTETLFHGSTLYFALISGVLYCRVLQKQCWRLFFQNKFLNVVLPYLMVSALLTVVYSLLYNSDKAVFSVLASVNTWLTNCLLGKADIHLWYMPVLLGFYGLTPLLVFLVRRIPILAGLLALLPLFISRSTFPDFLSWQTFVYFGGAYTLGLFVGEHWCLLTTWMHRHLRFLIVIASISTLILLSLYWFDYQPEAWSLRQSVVYLQKLAIFAVVLVAFQQWLTPLPIWLMKTATASFPIYFLHVLVMGTLIVTWMPLLAQYRNGVLFLLIGALNMTVTIAICILVAQTANRFLGRYARYLLGA